jgi:hypothetical protein
MISATVAAASGEIMAKIALVLAAGVIAASLVSGCRTVNVSDDHAIDQKKNTGVAVVSLTMAGLPGSTNMWLNYRGIGSDYKSMIPVTDILASSDWRCPAFARTRETAPCGRLAVVELPSGEYEFYSWHGGGNNMTYRSVKEFSKRFTVVQGKAVYLGNVHFSISDAPRVTFGTSQFAFRVNISDRRERDLPLLKAKHPKLTEDLLIINILPN